MCQFPQEKFGNETPLKFYLLKIMYYRNITCLTVCELGVNVQEIFMYGVKYKVEYFLFCDLKTK